MKPEEVVLLAERVKQEIQKVIIGQDDVTEMILVALFSKGHVLLEGLPGTAKTLLAQTFSKCLSLQFRRIQFTPDLMPGDILGTNIFNFQKNEFSLIKGPVFTDFLLADEINRTPPKTQAALLQAMQERTVTIDNLTFDLGQCFTVVATQNPIEQQGTYPLPEAQLDRFLCKVILNLPGREQEIDIALLHSKTGGMPSIESLNVQPVLRAEDILAIRETVSEVVIEREVMEYIVDITRATRTHASLQFGASTRAINMLATSTRAYALINGRDYVIPDDVKSLFIPMLRHRVIISPSAAIEGIGPDEALEQILNQYESPK